MKKNGRTKMKSAGPNNRKSSASGGNRRTKRNGTTGARKMQRPNKNRGLQLSSKPQPGKKSQRTPSSKRAGTGKQLGKHKKAAPVGRLDTKKLNIQRDKTRNYERQVAEAGEALSL
jgi:hypothetical protein